MTVADCTPLRYSLPRSRFRVLRTPRRRTALIRAIVLLAGMCCLVGAPAAQAAAIAPPTSASETSRSPEESRGGSSLESAAAKASSTGRTVAMSLIGLAFAVAAIVLAFKRDFKEAAGVFAVGIVCVMLATPTGVNVLKDTVSSVFGSH
jgi:hypothetical protein